MPDIAALTNWAGNHRYRAARIHRPRTLEELRAVVADARSLRALGTRHTFTDIGDSAELVALDQLQGANKITVDVDAMTVSVGAMVTYAQLAEALESRALALANMASLPHIAVVGAAATATHGSGDRLGNLATTVRAMELVTSAGDLLNLDATDDRLPGAVVHLGALGVVTRVTLAVQPSYSVRQTVYVGMEWDSLAENLDAITSAGRSVSVFHRFGERAREVWVKREDDGEPAPSQLFGAIAATAACHPVPDADPESSTMQLDVPGPWSERLPHFRAGFVPSAGEEIQSEWFVARDDGIRALSALRELAPQIRPLLLISELRTIAADQLWLSPHHGRDSIAIHFTWRREPAAVAALCSEVERVLAPFSPRPHWGKLFTATAHSIAPEYPRLHDFLALRQELDPRGAFINPWLGEKLLGA